jgi:2-hydroxychromene-2-carboxylate isomerase
MTEIAFYFDVGSPYAYLAAERVDERLGEGVVWQPVLLGGLFKLTGRSSWAAGDEEVRQRGMWEIEHRAAQYGLAPLHWPAGWPSDYLYAMRVATYAAATGRVREFALQAMRDAFARGARLDSPANVLEAARQAGLDPVAAHASTEDPQTKQRLREATDAAHRRGVFGVPTFAVGEELFWGDDRLDEAAAELRG